MSRQEEAISLLQHQSEEAGRTFSRELRERDERVSALLVEVEGKSSAVATLTQQLHRSRVLLKKAMDGQAESPSSNVAQPDRSTLRHSNRGSRRMHRTVSNPLSDKAKLCLQMDDVHPPPPPLSPPPSSSEGSRLSLSSTSLQRLSSPSEVARPVVSPPLTPRPPSTSPSGGSVRRASNPHRKSVQPHCSAPLDSLIMPTHTMPSELYADSTTTQAQLLKLGPVQSRKHSNPPQDVATILQSQGKEVQVKPQPPVLPPIQSDTRPQPPALPISQSDPGMPQKCTPLEGEDGTALTHDCTIIVGTRVHLPPGHRHIILAKSQGGLGSAPSTLRVVQYGGAGTGEDPSQGPEETAEGTLMVKENVSRKEQAWQELHQHGGD